MIDCIDDSIVAYFRATLKIWTRCFSLLASDNRI